MQLHEWYNSGEVQTAFVSVVGQPHDLMTRAVNAAGSHQNGLSAQQADSFMIAVRPHLFCVQGLLTAVPLEEGHKMLESRWKKAYKAGQQSHYLEVTGHGMDESSSGGRDARVQVWLMSSQIISACTEQRSARQPRQRCSSADSSAVQKSTSRPLP